MRVSSSSRSRIAPNSRPISASVSSVLGVLALVLEQPRVLDRHRDVRAELPQHHLVDLGELRRRVSLSRLSAPMTRPLRRSGTTSSRVRAGHRFDVARIRVHVVDEHRLPFGHGRADQPLPDLHAQRARDVLGIADRVRDRQLVALRVEQIHGERLELRQARDQLRDLLRAARRGRAPT